MRAAMLFAVQAAAGALAYDTYAYMKHPVAITERAQCDSQGCGKVGRDGYVPDSSSLFYPESREYGNQWDLCKGGHHCNDPYGKVKYEFFKEELHFEFVEFDRYGDFKFEEVEIKIERSGPPHEHSPTFGYENGFCNYEGGSLRCHAPYDYLVDGGSYGDMCPHGHDGNFIFYISIRILIVKGSERYEVFSKSIEEKKFFFSISYGCSSCHECDYHYDDKHYDDKHYDGKHYDDKHYDDKHYKVARRGGENEYGYEACQGALVEVYGTGEQHYHPLSEFGYDSHPESCSGHQGHYNRYSYSDLEISVAGQLTIDRDVFASYLIELEKYGKETEILVRVVIENADYFFTKLAVFLQCDGGIDNTSGYENNICRPETYPHQHYDPKGISSHVFQIKNDLKCKGDYFFVIFVEVCVSGGKDCEWKRI